MKFMSPIQTRRILSLFVLFAITSAVFANLRAVPSQKSGLTVEKAGTHLAYISHNGKPLLAFGCRFEHT